MEPSKKKSKALHSSSITTTADEHDPSTTAPAVPSIADTFTVNSLNNDAGTALTTSSNAITTAIGVGDNSETITAAASAQEELLLRRRAMNTIHSRRKRERQRIEIEVLKEQCAEYVEKNSKLQQENVQLEFILSKIQQHIQQQEESTHLTTVQRHQPPPSSGQIAQFPEQQQQQLNQPNRHSNLVNQHGNFPYSTFQQSQQFNLQQSLLTTAVKLFLQQQQQQQQQPIAPTWQIQQPPQPQQNLYSPQSCQHQPSFLATTTATNNYPTQQQSAMVQHPPLPAPSSSGPLTQWQHSGQLNEYLLQQISMFQNRQLPSVSFQQQHQQQQQQALHHPSNTQPPRHSSSSVAGVATTNAAAAAAPLEMTQQYNDITAAQEAAVSISTQQLQLLLQRQHSSLQLPMNMQQQQQLVVAHQLLMERQNVSNLLTQQQPPVDSSRTTGTASAVVAAASMTNPTSPPQQLQPSPSDIPSSPEQ
jgi:hypothetical protein